MTDEDSRWKNYRRANTERPSAREHELRSVFELVNPRLGERVWEAGAGNGYLTLPLADAVGSGGLIVATDVEEGNINDVRERVATCPVSVKALLLPVDRPFLNAEYDGAFDAVASIATFHHFDNRTQETGWKGRERALEAFYKALKPSGMFVLADVLHGTITQSYFDAIDNPKYCYPDGHPHDFPTTEELERAVRAVGFKDVKIETKFVPWQFSNKEEAKTFVHTIHNAVCSAEESFALAEKMLGFKEKEGRCELGWELFFLTAKK